MEPSEDLKNISSSDLSNLSLTIKRIASSIPESEKEIFPHFTPILRGLCSHKPEKRCGYVIIFNSLLDLFRDRISEKSALDFLGSFKFNKKSNKSSARTKAVAKILSNIAVLRSGIISTDEGAFTSLSSIFNEAKARPNLMPFISVSLSALCRDVNLKYIKQIMTLLPNTLDGLLFWFDLSLHFPTGSDRSILPPKFQQSTFNDGTAELIIRLLNSAVQPWNSPLFRFVVQNAQFSELLTFWPSSVEALARRQEPNKKFSVIMITKSVFDLCTDEKFPIIISHSFIKLLNHHLVQGAQQALASDFLQAIIEKIRKISIDSVNIPHPDIQIIIRAFRGIDSRSEPGFVFHRDLYSLCNTEQLSAAFESLKNTNNNEFTNFKLCLPAEKKGEGFPAFRLGHLRALFIGSAHSSSIQLSREIFDFIRTEFPDSHTQLASDIVDFDKARIPTAATLSNFIDDECNHFIACHLIYNLLFPTEQIPIPEIESHLPSPSEIQQIVTDSQKKLDKSNEEEEKNEEQEKDDKKTISIEFAVYAAQRASEALLIKYAYETRLKEIAPTITSEEMSKFLDNFEVAEDTLTSSVVAMFRIIVENCQFSISLIPALYRLFCKAISITKGTVAEEIGKMIESGLKRESGPFSLGKVLKGLFVSMNELSNRIVAQNEKLISRVFARTICSIIKSVPVLPSNMKVLEQYLETAVSDFAFKSQPHFSEDILSDITNVSNGIGHVILGPLLKFLPDVKRVQRKIVLLNLVSAVISLPKGLFMIETKADAFNKCIIGLLSENYGHNKEDEKKQMTVLKKINNWMQAISQKRTTCAYIDVAEIRRRIHVLLTQTKDPVNTFLKQMGMTLQKVEVHVHPKQQKNFQ